MSKKDLLAKYADEVNYPYDDYVKHYLVDHWKKAASQNDWEEVVSENFADRHSVEGSLSKHKAVDICRRRSGGGTRNFTSTTLDQGFIQKIVKYISDHLVAWHGKHAKEFRNYRIGVDGTMWTVRCEDGDFLPKCYRDSVVVGLDRRGLVTHFHGDASAAQGTIWKRNQKGDWTKN